MRSGDLQKLHGAKLHVDLKLGDMHRGAEDRVRIALPVFIERRGRRIVALHRFQHISRIIRVTRGEIDDPLARRITCNNGRACNRQLRIVGDIAEPKDPGPQRLAAQPGCIAGNEDLTAADFLPASGVTSVSGPTIEIASIGSPRAVAP